MDESFSSLFVQLRLNRQIPLRLHSISSTYSCLSWHNDRNSKEIMIYFHKKAYNRDLYRKFLEESYHHDHPLLAYFLLQHNMNFEKLVFIAKGHFLCMLFVCSCAVITKLPNAHARTHTQIWYYSLLLNLLSLCD